MHKGGLEGGEEGGGHIYLLHKASLTVGARRFSNKNRSGSKSKIQNIAATVNIVDKGLTKEFH